MKTLFTKPLAPKNQDIVFGPDEGLVLQFKDALSPTTSIVFGAVPVPEDAILGRLAAPMPRLSARVAGHVPLLVVTGRVGGGMPKMSGAARAIYSNDVLRGPMRKCGQAWQLAVAADRRIAFEILTARAEAAEQSSHWQDARPCGVPVSARFATLAGRSIETAGQWQDAAPISARRRAPWQSMTPQDAVAVGRWQEAQGVSAATASGWEDLIPARRFGKADWQDTKGLIIQVLDRSGAGLDRSFLRRHTWQDAIPPRPGVSSRPSAPDPHHFPATTDLLFRDKWTGTTAIIFGAPNTAALISVPIREVYLTINSATLVRLDTGDEIPVASASISIDYESWTWTLSAAAPGRALSQLQRNGNGDPVAVRLTVNGTPLHFLVESISRDRSFASSALRIQGRGFAAELDAPYAPTMSFANPFARTGRQLLDDILTLNGVPIGWSIDKALFTDWNVPAKVFSHTGTYISALNAVAGAIGAYIQPHDTERKLDVLLRYPTPAWAWGDVVPDFELPAAVTSQESIEWVTNPDYDRVFVVGQENGITGQYSRAGSAGTLVAETVTDPLITEAAAARQRGRSVLSEGGQIANVTLRLPVLAETGIIRPGKFVRYVDGSTVRKGLVRGVSADVAMPTIYQTVRVETRV